MLIGDPAMNQLYQLLWLMVALRQSLDYFSHRLTTNVGHIVAQPDIATLQN
jgi:hypothetical protein